MGLREQQARMQELAKLEQAQLNAQANASAEMPSVTQSAVLIALNQDVEKTFVNFLLLRTETNTNVPNFYLMDAFVDQHFNDGRTDQNDVIGYCLVYLLDIGHFEQAFNLAEKAIANGQRLPNALKAQCQRL